ncbi:SLATT domain-containing protein [Roseateles amylovorans]|uniref:SLATT domain-containing protein n=1 Tax=Roseateles amylovorans TaxID=2978473 RepID=A0ABY6AXS0_9BURK|nr:SLATT domain-containing protein [Roseateles amylovorans]UXH77984.1 SLATT domain-containing protein [Roseateles amylovorans]
MNQFLADLRTTAWRTAGARYNAARRLKRREWLSTCSLALLSAVSIAVAFAQKVFASPNTAVDNYLTAVAMGVGVLLLTLSLLEWGAGYGARAQELHGNAEHLTNFQQKIALRLAASSSGAPITFQEADALRAEYEDIKDNCSANHQPIDDALFRAQKRLDPVFRVKQEESGAPRMGQLKAFCIGVLWFCAEAWFFGLVWIIVACSIAYAFRLA